MKKNYLFFLITLLFCTISYAQTSCSDTQPDIGYAYSHAKSAYDSNNLTQLKRFASRSLEAFNRLEPILKDCNCQDAYYEATDAMEALREIATKTVYEDARFYIKRAREHAKQSIGDLEICTKWSSEDFALAEIENEQRQLEEQRIILNQKQEKLRMQLAQKVEKSKLIKKEKLIAQKETVLSNSINSFNELLSACGCTSIISQISIDKDDLMRKDIDSIKTIYLNKIREVSSNYIQTLNQCTPR